MKRRTWKVFALVLVMIVPVAGSLAGDGWESGQVESTPAVGACGAAERVTIGDATFAAAREAEPEVTRASCSASADCWDGSTVSCSASGTSASCSGTDSNCPSTNGSVVCNGVTTSCPTCPNCSVFNKPNCTYVWNPVGCCVPTSSSTGICLGYCW